MLDDLDVNEYADESIKLHFAERVDSLIFVHAARWNHSNHLTVNLFHSDALDIVHYDSIFPSA